VALPPPYEDYAIARSAVRAALDCDAPRFAPTLWLKADGTFRSGERAYKDADFEVAKKYFITSTTFAERAENATRLKKFQTGENAP
jgi:hypothetical protein